MKLLLTIAMLVACAATVVTGSVEPYVSPVQYRPHVGRVGDTIPFYWKGEYHVFYLCAGRGEYWTFQGVPWAHIVSRDLIHWKELPDALTVGGPNDPDRVSCFTGSVIEKDGTFHAFYTGWSGTENPHPNGREQIMHATSSDLINWTKHPQDTFNADRIHYQNKGGVDFRDPCVFWNEKERNYWMLLCARDAKTGDPVTGVAICKDLARWEQVSPIVQKTLPYAASGETAECPDLFKIGDIYYLLFSSCKTGVTAMRYSKDMHKEFIDPEPPVVKRPVPLPSKRIWAGVEQPEHGIHNLDTHCLYAAKSMFDGKRHVLVGWIGEKAGEKDYGGWVWGGTMCIPRELYPGPRGQLYVRPVPEATKVFSHAVPNIAKKPTLEAGSQCSFDVPDNYMMECRIKMDPDAVLTVAMRQQAKPESKYYILLRPSQKEIALGGSGFSLPRKCDLDAAKPIKVQAFVLGSIIECFVNDAYAFTCRAYDYRSGKLSLSVTGGKARVLELTVSTN